MQKQPLEIGRAACWAGKRYRTRADCLGSALVSILNVDVGRRDLRRLRRGRLSF
jgi:hypothetical protein